MTRSASNFQLHENEPLSEATTLAPDITLVAVPLDSIADASGHLRDVLTGVDIITAEDTWWTHNLATTLGISPKGKFISNFDHNEDSRTKSLIQAAKVEQKVIMAIGAGMPAVSGPSPVVVAAAHDAGVSASCVPRSNAMITALALSNLDVGHSCFDGFVPRKKGAYRVWLESLKTEKRACCFFRSPHRLAVTLADTAETLDKERCALVNRELTKRFEETRHAMLGELAAWTEEGARGEITVVIKDAGQQAVEVSTENLVDRIEDLVADDMRLKDTAEQVMAEAGMTKHRDLYRKVLAAREENR